jgi:hypothetical protein
VQFGSQVRVQLTEGPFDWDSVTGGGAPACTLGASGSTRSLMRSGLPGVVAVRAAPPHAPAGFGRERCWGHSADAEPAPRRPTGRSSGAVA